MKSLNQDQNRRVHLTFLANLIVRISVEQGNIYLKNLPHFDCLFVDISIQLNNRYRIVVLYKSLFVGGLCEFQYNR